MPLRTAIALLAAAALCGTGVAAADADDAATLTVVGTSDVFDSGLVQHVLEPGFEAEYPQYRLRYVSKGSGAAIAYAQAGTASALLVHAAPLESRFVAGGYSAEPYGRAIFWGDYVLLGPGSDPAGVATSAPHDVATAFERIAAAGASGRANFVSRGGTPGTTVQEHAIWALTHGVGLCTVGAGDGGGRAPSARTGACPASGGSPSWYHATGLTQGPNVENAETCNYPGGGCYALTDRGTFAYLRSSGAIHVLRTVARANASSARGGANLLVNGFRAYAIAPGRFAGRPNVRINLPAALAFLDWVTSPLGQAAVADYLAGAGDPPFHPDAAPAIRAAPLPAAVAGGRVLTVSGSVTDTAPGAPRLAGQTVTLSALPAAVAALDPVAAPLPVAHTLTRPDGDFTLRYRPVADAIYAVSTTWISRIENTELRPAFGALLAPAAQTLGRVGVHAAVRGLRVCSGRGAVMLHGRVVPAPRGHAGALTILAAPRAGDALRRVGHLALRPGQSTFTLRLTTRGVAPRLRVGVLKPRPAPRRSAGDQRPTAGLPHLMRFLWEGIRHAVDLISHGDDELVRLVRVTLEVAAVSTAIALVVGLPIGLALGLGRFRGRRAGLVLANAGLGLPPVLVGLVLSLLMFPEAPLGGLHLLFTLKGVYVAQTVLALPIVVALTSSAVQSVPAGLLDQARALGAGRGDVWWLALREARIGVLAATIAAVGSALSEVGAVVLVGGNIQGEDQTLASAALQQVDAGHFAQGVAIGIILLGLILLVTAALTFAQQRADRPVRVRAPS